MRFRVAREREKALGAQNGFEHSSKRDDLAAVVAAHLIDPEAAKATVKWRPSRRGNSSGGLG